MRLTLSVIKQQKNGDTEKKSSPCVTLITNFVMENKKFKK